jgi:hypothetical protein
MLGQGAVTGVGVGVENGDGPLARVHQRDGTEWWSESVNDPLPTRGDFAAVIDGQCSS